LLPCSRYVAVIKVCEVIKKIRKPSKGKSNFIITVRFIIYHVYLFVVFEEIFLLKMSDYPLNEIVDTIRIVGGRQLLRCSTALFGKILRQTLS